MNYNDFRYKAEVDLLDIRVRLSRPSHVSHMRKYSGLGFVKAINPGSGGAATIFDLRFDAPKRYTDIRAALNRVEDNLRDQNNKFVCLPVVRRMEVSLDAYAKYEGIEPWAFAELVVGMTVWHQYPASEPRLYDKHYKEKPFIKETFITDVMHGYMVGMGDKDHDHFQRAYYKTTDNVGKIKLPIKQCRARFENNYSGDALPVTELADLACFKFQTLANSGFSFRSLSKAPTDPLLKRLHETLVILEGRLGRRLSPTPRGKPAYRNSGSHTRAIEELNGPVRQALCNLSNRWAAGSTIQPKTCSRDTTQIPNSGVKTAVDIESHQTSFSVGFLSKIPYFMWICRTSPNNCTYNNINNTHDYAVRKETDSLIIEDAKHLVLSYDALSIGYDDRLFRHPPET